MEQDKKPSKKKVALESNYLKGSDLLKASLRSILKGDSWGSELRDIPFEIAKKLSGHRAWMETEGGLFWYVLRSAPNYEKLGVPSMEVVMADLELQKILAKQPPQGVLIDVERVVKNHSLYRGVLVITLGLLLGTILTILSLIVFT